MTSSTSITSQPLPEGWDWATIAETCERPEYGHTATADPNRVGPQFLRITDIQATGVDWQRVPYCKCGDSTLLKLALNQGDLLVARIGATTGKAYLVRDCPQAVFASYLIRLRTRSVNSEFLYYFTKSPLYWGQVDANKGDKLKGGISGSVLATLRHPLPPPTEQRAIAHALFALESRLRVEQRRTAVLKELKAATMAKLFRTGFRGQSLVEQSVGEIPRDWRVEPLEALLSEPIRNGHSASESSDRIGIPTFTLTAVTKRDFGPENIKITTADPYRVEDLWARDGDIYVERANTREMVGLAALYRGSNRVAIFPDLLMRVRVDERRLLPEILESWLLDSRCRSYFRGAARGTASSMPKIDQSTVLATPVLVPPFEDQRRIADVSVALDLRIAESLERGTALRQLFAVSLDSLMKGTLRVAAEALLHA
jgi:type I restriction enzyme S subunit